MDFSGQMEAARRMVEARLSAFFPGGGLEEAMRYSLMAGGKRIRPILTVKFCEAAGGGMEQALDFGCGLEMLHTYSLIHDDLPCVDNDDLRRGKPTCHKVYGECAAMLAGDALQAAAFRTVLSAQGDWTDAGAVRALAGRILAEASGERGMCGGQYLDTLNSKGTCTAEELTQINDKKTGALLRAACMMGVAAALGSSAEQSPCMDAARTYATYLGLAFQIRDDMLDAASTEQELGKPIGSDAANQKVTYASLLGLERCGELVLDFTEQAKAALTAAHWRGESTFLLNLADALAQRWK